MELQERIKSRREELNMSIRSVALALDLAPSTVMRYETSAIQNMGIDKIESLSKVLRCSPAYLMGWTDNPLPDSVLCAGGKLPEDDIKYQEAVAYTLRKLEELPTLKDAQNFNHLVELYDRLDDIDKGKIIERMETMLEGEKYKK